MKSVLVGKADNIKIYYVLDAQSNQNDGVVVDEVGNVDIVNFWNFVNNKSSINKIQHSNFHKFLWNKPEGEERKKWQSIFITKTLLPDDDLIDSVAINNDVLNRKKTINHLANRALDFKIALSSQTLEEKILKKMGRRIGRSIGANRKIGKRVFREVQGVLDPQKRRDNDGDGMIFDGTRREMPAPSGVSNRNQPDILPDSRIAITDDMKRPTSSNLKPFTDIQGNRKNRLLKLLKLNGNGAGKKEINDWYRKHLAGVSVNNILRKKRKIEKNILDALNIDRIRDTGHAREILSMLYPHAAPEHIAYRHRGSKKKANYTFFEFLWYNPDGSLRDDKTQLSESELTLFLGHIRLLQQNQSIAENAVHYISGTTSYKSSKIFAEGFINAIIRSGVIPSSPDEFKKLMPAFLLHQIKDNKTKIVPIVNSQQQWELVPIDAITDWGDYAATLNQMRLILSLNPESHIKDIAKEVSNGLFEHSGGANALGYVSSQAKLPSYSLGLDFLPSRDFINKVKNINAPTTPRQYIEMMYRDGETDGLFKSNIVGIDEKATLSDAYFTMSSIATRITIARQLAELGDVRNKKNIEDKINRIVKKQTKIKESMVELSLSEEFNILQKDLQDLEAELRDLSILTDELSDNLINQLIDLSAMTTTYHENGHFLHGSVMATDITKKIKIERNKRIDELRAKQISSTDEEKELEYLTTPEIEDKMLLGWLFKRLHLNASDEEIIPRLSDTESELAILGFIQIFGNISTPLEIDLNTASEIEKNVLRKNSIFGLLIDALRKNTSNSNPKISSAASAQLKEIIELHKHKLQELIIDPITNLPVQISQSTIDKILEKNNSAISFLRNNPSMGDSSKLQERLKLLTPAKGDLTLGNLLKIIAIEQLVGQFGLDKATRMSGAANNIQTYYPQGVILGTDASIKLPQGGNVVPSPGQNMTNIIYGANVTDILPTVVRFGLPKFFEDEENNAFMRSINSYALSHLGHYADVVQGKPKPLVKIASTLSVEKDIELISARDTFEILKNAFKRLKTNTAGDSSKTKNHTISSYLSAMPNLGMSNLAKLIESNSDLRDKSKKGNFAEFYKLLDDEEKTLVRRAIYDDVMANDAKEKFNKIFESQQNIEAYINLNRDIFTSLYQAVRLTPDPYEYSALDSVLVLIKNFTESQGTTYEMFQEAYRDLIKTIMEPKLRAANIPRDARQELINAQLELLEQGSQFARAASINAIHDLENYFAWDEMSSNEVDTIIKMVQRWGGEIGEPSYAMHDYRTARVGHLFAALRLKTLGGRLEWAEIPAEINLILETGIPFLTDGRNLTEEELNALTKLTRWMRPDEKQLPEIKSLQAGLQQQKEDRWLI